MTTNSPTSSLQDLDDVAGRIRLHRSVDSRPTVIVEGRSDDIVLSGLVEDVVIFVAGNKSKALEAAAQLTAWGIDGHVVVVDRDFVPHDLETAGAVQPVYYNGRDLESMLVRDGAAEQLLSTHMTKASVALVGAPSDYISKCTEALTQLAALRKLALEEGVGLAFDRVSLTPHVSWPDMTLDTTAYVTVLIARAGLGELPEDVINRAASVDVGEWGPQGKDLIAMLASGLKHRLLAGASGINSVDAFTTLLFANAYRCLVDSKWIRSLNKRLDQVRSS